MSRTAVDRVDHALALPPGRLPDTNRSPDCSCSDSLPDVPVRQWVLSLPALGGPLSAPHGLAQTRPNAAGLAAGLLAGEPGASGHALACTELAPSFAAAWCTPGVVTTGAPGALLQPQVPRLQLEWLRSAARWSIQPAIV
jgi:Negative regulator of sigma F